MLAHEEASMARRTDQDEPRKVGDRVAPATTPDRDTIREDREALTQDHGADRMPEPEEEEAAERSGPTDPDVAESYKEALERGAAQEGEGRAGR
jgi:hypothetical protein